MRGLDPRIHPSSEEFSMQMDGRVKPGHDGLTGNRFAARATVRILQRREDGFPDSSRIRGALMKRIATVFAGLLLAWPALAHTPQQPPHQTYSEGDLKLESG